MLKAVKKLLPQMVMLTMALFFTSTAMAFSQAQAAEKVKRKPNIVFVLADDEGWSDVEMNGAKFHETPNISRVAAEGIKLTDAYTSGPNCAPTRASLISGMYTPRHLIYTPKGNAKGDPRLMKLDVVLSDEKVKRYGLKTVGKQPFETRTDLAPSVLSIAEVLNQAGYATARFGKWHVGPDLQGFDKSDDVIFDGLAKYSNPLSTERITDKSIDFIKTHKDDNFFVYVSYYDVHKPLRAKQAVIDKYDEKHKSWTEDERQYNTTYAAMVEEVDSGVGRLLDTLDELGLSDNTLFIYTSDNGGLREVSYNEPLRAGKGALYEGGVRVPFAARWPAVIKAGTISHTPITSVDFLPTFAELAKLKLANVDLPNKQQPVDGVSIMPIFQGGDLEDRPIFWHYPLYLDGAGRHNYIPYEGGTIGIGQGWRAKPASAMRWGKWKLIEYFEDDHLELYNLEQDISEAFEVSAKYPEVTQKLYKRLLEWRKETKAVVPQKRPPTVIEL